MSYDARAAAGHIALERVLLEDASGRPVLGSRHHYWHMTRPFWQSLVDHAHAGLRYDASVAFNDQPGFRLGIAFPFHPWNPLSEEPIRALQIPTFLMDGMLFRDPEANVDDAVARFARLLEALKRYAGVASFDWHVRHSYPGPDRYRKMGETYLAILELLGSDPEVEVAPCREALDRFGYHLL